MIHVVKQASSNERWIVNENGKIEKWFLEKEDTAYIILRKTREPKPDGRRIMVPKGYAYTNEREAKIAENIGLVSKAKPFNI